MLVYQRVTIEHGEPIIKHGDFNIHQQQMTINDQLTPLMASIYLFTFHGLEQSIAILHFCRQRTLVQGRFAAIGGTK